MKSNEKVYWLETNTERCGLKVAAKLAYRYEVGIIRHRLRKPEGVDDSS